MARIRVLLPSVMAAVTQGELEFALDADSVALALATIARERPGIALHLFDESGGFRQHVLCFLNETNTRWLDNLDAPLQDGDTLLFMQAVSGG
ncbi:MAG: MoaD/ThiS family protein [Planctomycetes bacterium]|nr:MoaD/ThiS family protein [Planctomycetota bacterium]